MGRTINFLNTLFSILILLWVCFYLKDPQLLPIRNYESYFLSTIAIAGLGISLVRLRYKTWLPLTVLALWSSTLGIVGYHEYEFYTQKQTLQKVDDEKASQLAVLGEHIIVGYDVPNDVKELARRGFITGIYVSRRNAKGKTFEQLRAELSELQDLRIQAKLPPLIISTDQEGGTVSRLSPPLGQQPSLASLLIPGITNSQIEERAFAYGEEQARKLTSLGINMNFSPVVDLTPQHKSSMLDFHTRIADRAIAADPNTVTQVALPYSRALLSQGVVPTLKHFPGLGSVAEDTHHFSATLRLPLDQLNNRDWLPFQQILNQVPAALMIGHVIVPEVDPTLPASLSGSVITGIIRNKWKFNGVIISDDMTMAAVYDRGLCQSSIQSLNAGMDLLLLAYDWEKVYPVISCLRQAQNSGKLVNLDASRSRIDTLRKENFNKAQHINKPDWNKARS